MALWFQKGEYRRFRRINMPIRVFVTPVQPIKDQQIFALGIDYFPPTVQKKIQASHESLNYWVRHIQEQQEILAPVFGEVEDSVQYFGRCVEGLSVGRSPKSERLEWAEFNRYSKGVESILALKVTAPKTFQYFEQMNQKLKVYYHNLFNLFEGSTPTQLNLESELPDSMLVDEMMKRFESKSFAKIPLVQSLFHLHQLMGHYFSAYTELLKDVRLRQNPNAWEEIDVNLSACGLSLVLEKRFKPNTRCDAYFYFAEKGRMLSVRAVLIRANSSMSDYREHNSFNFEFPDIQDQRFIQLEIERYEIQSSLNVPLS
ncbi:hypothetical protein [Thiosulfativibrio zosterae]|nr:hypothetical protein [Thiosulfativibrio zosterae]